MIHSNFDKSSSYYGSNPLALKRHAYSYVFLLRPPLPKARSRGGRQFFYKIFCNYFNEHFEIFENDFWVTPYEKNWRLPRLRAFGSGARKRNTYEYACLLTRPDCCRNRKKVCQTLNEWIVIAIILIMYSSSTLIRRLVFLKLKKNYPKNSSLSHEEPMTLSNLIFRKLKGFQNSGVFIDWIWKKKISKAHKIQ